MSTLRIRRGEDVDILCSPTTTTAVTSWELTFSIGTEGAATPTLTVTSADGEITITDAAAGEFTVSLTRAQTLALTRRSYTYALWRVDSGSYQMLASGPFVVDRTQQPS